MKLPIITTLVIAISFLTITITEAKIYTWIDASGQKHYSATPPKLTERISGLKSDLRITDNKIASTKIKEEKTTPIKSNNKNKPQTKIIKKRNFCHYQRKNLRLLNKHTKRNRVKDGKNRPLTNKQRKNKIRIIENNIRISCSFGRKIRNRKPKLPEKKIRKRDR